MNYVPARYVSLKDYPDPNYREKWIQKLIADDPSILGLGNLVLRDQERIQPRAGRLDLLLQDLESQRRYEVEIQLGATDESHIIRAIEYFDIEKKRYPQYEHCAVLIAEDITSRFLNVISLFNGALPLIAIQMQVVTLGDVSTVIFTKVMDELVRGVVDEDEEAEAAPTDRDYWESTATEATVRLADEMLNSLQTLDPSLRLTYTKYYIGLEKDDHPFNFVNFTPQKNRIVYRIKLPQSNETDSKIDDAGLVRLEYNKAHASYQISLVKDDIKTSSHVLMELSKDAYERRIRS